MFPIATYDLKEVKCHKQNAVITWSICRPTWEITRGDVIYLELRILDHK